MAGFWLEGVKLIWFVETKYDPPTIALKTCYIASNSSIAITSMASGDSFNKYNAVIFSLISKGNLSGVILLPCVCLPLITFESVGRL